MSNVGTVAYTPTYSDALAYASGLHAAHLRKGDGPAIPYIAHLLTVSALVWEAVAARAPGAGEPTNQDLAIAALLHDAVEDQGGRPVLDEIRSRFGNRVADIVDACTDADVVPKPPWRARKEAHLERIGTTLTGTLYVIAADKLHNVTSMIDDYLASGDLLWERFDAPCKPADIFWYHREIHSVLVRRLGDVRLVGRLGEGIARLEGLHESAHRR